ncbi:MAG TPA: NAD(P)-dependent oxidoreductase [Anaerolineae bacterium]|nr:NAD(P)-dependent oxidoreductase [Anaerolineae bacterium]
MFIIDTELAKREKIGQPIRVAMTGAGYMARAIALQIVTGMKGMKLVAISNRTLAGAELAYRRAGVTSVCAVKSAAELAEALERNDYAITDDATLLCEGEGIDAIIEATGEIEFGAQIAFLALQNGKHLISVNAQIDTAIGPILKVYADRAGVVFTNIDGDEPGVAMNLIRFIKTTGYEPVLAGNMKGFIDPYRTPETQAAFAAKYNQKPRMITSFADGTKLSMETAILANATGFKVGKRGMFGPKCDHIADVINYFTVEQLLQGGLVDYTLGAAPNNGAFVVAYNEHPLKQEYMTYFKMGSGPLYVFYTPYHLPHLQLPLTVARAVLFNDPTVTPQGAPSCEVISIAKRDLKAGETLDGLGGFTCYGLIENSEICQAEKLLPIALSEDCRLKRDIAKDQAISYADIDLPTGRLCDKLRAEQNAYFSNSTI